MSDQVGNTEDRFSHNEAQLCNKTAMGLGSIKYIYIVKYKSRVHVFVPFVIMEGCCSSITFYA